MSIQGLDQVDRELIEGRVPVFAVPHHTIFLSVLGYRNRRATLLASLSKDGELAAQFLQRRGFALVRGSSSRGGKEALHELRSALDLKSPVAITFDGPRGPRLRPKPGIALCAWHATGALFLLKHTVEPSPLFKKPLCIRLKSWDRFVLPLPGMRLRVEFEKLELPQKETHSREEWVEKALKALENRCQSFYGSH
ncbi:MAG: hypothetical protein RIR26_2800 [Pseudomonadota bacterium]